jgi:CRP-like cAMP-binding protein
VDKAAALGRTVLFGNLQPEALKELAAIAHSREMTRGEVLFLAGEKATGLFVIASGRIRAYRVNTQGREQTIHVERDGATLAEVPVFDDGSYPATAVAEEPTTVLFLEKGDVRRFMLKHPEVCLTALKLMAQRLRGHAALVDALALQQVGQRLARLLLTQSRDHGTRTEAGIQFDLALSNEELARSVGSVREVVSRTLTRLERDGLIAQANGPKQGKRRRFVIADEAALARYSGETAGEEEPR